MPKKGEPKKLVVKQQELKSVKRKPVISASSVETFLKIGQTAPAFSLPDESGEMVSLKSFKGKKIILYFYPKDHTPGCTQESCDFRDNFSKGKGSKLVVFGISRDSVASHQKFKTKLDLPYSLLSDEAGKVCEAFGVWKEKTLYGRKYMGIERTTFLIDEKGKVALIYPKVSVKGHVDKILEDLKKL